MIKNGKKSVTPLFAAAVLTVASLLTVGVSAGNIEYSPSSSYASGEYYARLCEVTLTGNQAEDIVNVAKSQVGYHESSSGDLSGYGSGEGNYTEYGEWYGMQSYWCNMFATWCARVAGVPESIIPQLPSATSSYQSVLPSAGADCFSYSSDEPLMPGDLIFSCTCGAGYGCIDHVGIVVDADEDTIYTVEGNMSDMVKSCTYPVYSGYQEKLDARINYVARPQYEDNSVKEPVCELDENEVKPSNTALFNGSKYEIYDVAVSYEQAALFAKLKGGALAVADGKNEAKMLQFLLKECEAYYMGGESESVLLNEKCDNSESELGKVGFIIEYEDNSEKVTLVYDANGGESAPIEKVAENGTEIVISDVVPVNKNKAFLGWSKDEKADKVQFKSGDTLKITENTVFYAVWG